MTEPENDEQSVHADDYSYDEAQPGTADVEAEAPPRPDDDDPSSSSSRSTPPAEF
jgi:hypothetical protein